MICYIAKQNKSKIKKTAPRFQRSRATAVNISRVTVNCFPFDVIVFTMLPAHGIWRETVSLLDVMWPWTSHEWARCSGKNASYITTSLTYCNDLVWRFWSLWGKLRWDFFIFWLCACAFAQSNLFRNGTSKRPSTRFTLELLLGTMEPCWRTNFGILLVPDFDWLIRIENSSVYENLS